jgi:ABC-type phosphate/phosphonate transport system substrate-binding protein
VRIGMAATLFKDMPESTVRTMLGPFGALMEVQTGVRGEVVLSSDAMSMAQSLADNHVQLAVFHGIEFAWAKIKHPELKPLVIAVNQQVYLRALVMVRGDSKAANLTDLEAKSVALPRGTREHCGLYVEHHCRECKKEVQGYFAKITTPANAEEALDDVVDGVVEGTVIDGVSLETYKRRKPGRFAKLKEAGMSDLFPGGVIAYRPGSVDDGTLKKFRDGLTNANSTILGKQLLTLWKLTAFEPVPGDFEQVLTEIVKTYPPPAGK